MGCTAATDLDMATESTTANVRLRLSPRLLPIPTTTVATALDTVVCTAAMDLDTATESTTASVRLRLSPRLLLSPTTTAMVDMVLATGATEDTEVTAMAIPIGAKAPF